MTLFAVLTLGLAFGPIVWLARARITGRREWFAAAAAVAATCGSAVLVGSWALISVHLRPVTLVALAAALLLSWHRATRWSAEIKKRGIRRRPMTWRYATACLFTLVVADALAGRLPPAGSVDLRFPLEPGQYAVLQGGNSFALNPFHRWFASDNLALDIVKLNRFGNRAGRITPASLTDHAIYDAAVLSPCTGTAERVENDLPDHAPGDFDWQHPPGNHVLLRCGDVRVLLAHLRRGSVVVSPDASIAAGALVGRVGNSGGTREPHLHIGAVAADGAELPSARGVAMLLEGRFLCMNDVVERR